MSRQLLKEAHTPTMECPSRLYQATEIDDLTKTSWYWYDDDDHRHQLTMPQLSMTEIFALPQCLHMYNSKVGRATEMGILAKFDGMGEWLVGELLDQWQRHFDAIPHGTVLDHNRFIQTQHEFLNSLFPSNARENIVDYVRELKAGDRPPNLNSRSLLSELQRIRNSLQVFPGDSDLTDNELKKIWVKLLPAAQSNEVNDKIASLNAVDFPVIQLVLDQQQSRARKVREEKARDRLFRSGTSSQSDDSDVDENEPSSRTSHRKAKRRAKKGYDSDDSDSKHRSKKRQRRSQKHRNHFRNRCRLHENAQHEWSDCSLNRLSDNYDEAYARRWHAKREGRQSPRNEQPPHQQSASNHFSSGDRSHSYSDRRTSNGYGGPTHRGHYHQYHYQHYPAAQPPLSPPFQYDSPPPGGLPHHPTPRGMY